MTINKVINKLIRDEMHYDEEYSYEKMLAKYTEVTELSEFIEIGYKPMSYKALRNLLCEWSNVDGGWLAKKGMGKMARFYKRQPEYMTMAEIRKEVKAWLLCQISKLTKS